MNVQREQADRGLVLTIAEHGSNGRNTGAAMCVVYGNTNIICDPNATVTPEEYTLLRFLGSNFINPSEIDENSHWKIQSSDSTVSTVADYHIASNANGMMQITEVREVTQHGPGERRTNIQTKIGYDFNKIVPTSIDEYNVDRVYGGSEANSTSTFQTTLKLVSDSMATPMANHSPVRLSVRGLRDRNLPDDDPSELAGLRTAFTSCVRWPVTQATGSTHG